MKYLKYLFSSMLIAGALALAGCGSDGDTRADGDRNVIKEEVLDREINLDGVIRSYKTGAPLSSIQVTLIQLSKVRSTTTVDLNGHYSFTKVKVASDQGAQSDADNSSNTIQLEFKELKTKKLNGDGDLVNGSDLYENGTTTATYPESRLSFTLVSPDLSGPELNAADDSAGDFAEDAAGALNPQQSLSLVDAINEGRSYYFVDANTVRIRDVRMVGTGSLTGSVADSLTGLPIDDATITLDTDSMFRSPSSVAGDIVLVWQNTRISTTSDVLGNFTLSKVPALDYLSFASETFHVEATGYTQTSVAGTLTMDHSNIQDDLIGSVGVWLLSPIRYDDVAFTLKVVDENLLPLSGVAVTFTYDNTIVANTTSGYGLSLANGIATDTVWTFTSDANGLVSGTVPNISFAGGAGSKNLLVTKNGYALQGYNSADTDLSTLTHNDSPIDLDVSFLALTIFKADLGVVHMQQISIPNGEMFTIQLVYGGQPLEGVTATGFYAFTNPITGLVMEGVVSADSASDANGFISFSNSIPAGLYDTASQGIVLSFDTSAATNGITGADLSSYNLKLDTASDAADTSLTTATDGKMDFNNTGAPARLGSNGTAGGILKVGESGSTVSAVFTGSDKLLGTLQGYLVEGTKTKTAGVVADQTVGLSVTPLSRLAKTYFSTTDSTGKYIFTATAAPATPVTGTAYSVKIPVNVAGTGAGVATVGRLLKLKLMDTSKVFSVWVTALGATTVTDAGLDADGTEIWLNSSTNIASRNGIDQISSGTNTWLEQMTGDNAVGTTSALIPTGYADQTLTVHTAQIQDITKLNNGFHVLTVVDGSDAKPVIYTSNINVGNATYAQRSVYTFPSTGNSDAVKIIMSGAVDYSRTWLHTGGSVTTDNRVTINATGTVADTYASANTDGNDATVLGTEFVYDTTAVDDDTTAAVGRSIYLTPAGNADKFELGKIYRVYVSVYDANGNRSDDTIEFRFFDVPLYANMTPTLAVYQMCIQNDTDPANNRNIGWANSNAVAADLASYKTAWNDKNLDDVVDAREVNVLLSNVGTGVATAAMGANQSTSIKLSRVTLRFPEPTYASGTALTDAELVTLDAANNYRVFAQAYKATDGRIIRSWTNVSTDLTAGGTINGDDTRGSDFSAQTAGYWTISCNLDGIVDSGILTFADALANGDSVDLAVVYKDNQIDATKVITLNGTRSGIQPSALLNGAGNETHVDNINFGVSTDVIVTLNEAVNSTDTSVPTMTVVDTRLSLASPRYINDQQIQGQLTWTAPAARTSLTTQALTAVANVVVPTNGAIVVGNDIYLPNGTASDTTNNKIFARNTSVNNRNGAVLAFANNVTVNTFQSFNTTLSVFNDQAYAAGTNAAGATTATEEDPADNSTSTFVDIDWAGIADGLDGTGGTATQGNLTAAAIWTNNTTILYYSNCNDLIKAQLNTLPTGYRLYLSNGTSLELGVNVANTSWTIQAVNANATAATGDTTNAKSTFGITTPVAVPATSLFTPIIFGRIECAAGLVAADATLTGTVQDSVTQNNAFGLRSAIAFTAVPVSTTTFTYTEVGGQRLRAGDTLYISQKQSAIGNVWNHGTATVVSVLTNGTANVITIGALSGIDGTTATSLVFTQGVAVTDIHVIFYGDQVTVGLGGATGLRTATAGNTASTLTVGAISFPSQTAANSDPFKDASTNSATSTYVMAAGGLPTPSALTFGAVYDIFVK